MENDPLQQLRDVHLPPDPSWWPPAPGWWLLAAAAVALLAWFVYRLMRTYRRRAPIRAARGMLDELYAGYTGGQVSAQEYLHRGNEILKRLLVRAFGRREYARLSGEDWLRALDQLSASDAFTNGAGRILGNERFRAQPDIDVDALNGQLSNLLAKVRP